MCEWINKKEKVTANEKNYGGKKNEAKQQKDKIKGSRSGGAGDGIALCNFYGSQCRICRRRI